MRLPFGTGRRGYRATDGATLVHFTLHSAAVGSDLHEILVRPPKRGSRLLLVLLHGRSSSPSSFLNQPFFDALASLGDRAPAVLLLGYPRRQSLPPKRAQLRNA